jgi:WD40 repeat protein
MPRKPWPEMVPHAGPRRALGRVTHDGSVSCVAFSPDGKQIATASDDHTARVWDSTTGRELARLTHDHSVRVVAFRSDGKQIATASLDQTARVWDSTTGRELARLTHADMVLGVAFSPDHKRIATASYDHTARVWDDLGWMTPLGLLSALNDPWGASRAEATQLGGDVPRRDRGRPE